MKRSTGAILTIASCRRVLGWLLAIAFGFIAGDRLFAQSDSALGLKRLTQDQWTIITDMPIDREIESWPKVLDQALLSWCQKWSIDAVEARKWPLVIHWIGDRKLFEQAGLLEGVPPFEDGLQIADKIFLREQPSVYYRRHLLLHEATHWVMYRAFGGGGSPWFMEGMAEIEGTHLWKDDQLTMGIIPGDASSVPHWGRFKRLAESTAAKRMPSIKQILRYGNERENRMDRYVWSWAACIYLRNHPVYGPLLGRASAAPLDYSMKLSEEFEKSLLARWDWVERDWKLFVDDFDFGYQPESNLVAIEDVAQGIRESGPSEFTLDTDCAKGWQLARCYLKAGEQVEIHAQGTYVVRSANQEAWESSPDGITYEYHRRMPLGKLLGGFVSTDTSAPLEVFGVGKQAVYEAQRDGWLLFRVNEPVGQRLDNSGTLQVRGRITSSRPR